MEVSNVTNFQEQLHVARQTHDELRRAAPGLRNDDSRVARCRMVTGVLDRLWEATDGVVSVSDASAVRRAIRRLKMDAEYHAGLSDAEGIRDPAEVAIDYATLERAFTDAR
jgi:hypothetical protein